MSYNNSVGHFGFSTDVKTQKLHRRLILYKNINVPLSVVLNVIVVSDDIKTQKNHNVLHVC